jgi:hypothetical protein
MNRSDTSCAIAGPRSASILAAASTQPALYRWTRVLPLVVVPTIVVAAFPDSWPRWIFMWTFALAIYAGCKCLTWTSATDSRVPARRSLGYLATWPGMDAAAFLHDDRNIRVPRPTTVEWSFALAKALTGLVLLFVAIFAAVKAAPLVAGWLGMVALVFVLHFGVFHLLSCGWRRLGVDACPLMNWPVRATSLREFWGRRWNRAFRDLAHRHLFIPLCRTCGASAAMALAFLVSGMVHDLVISLPAGGGYGGPTAYFAIQAAGLTVERTRVSKLLGLGDNWRGWTFTMLVLLLPLPWLFHRHFVKVVVFPMLQTLAGLI